MTSINQTKPTIKEQIEGILGEVESNAVYYGEDGNYPPSDVLDQATSQIIELIERNVIGKYDNEYDELGYELDKKLGRPVETVNVAEVRNHLRAEQRQLLKGQTNE